MSSSKAATGMVSEPNGGGLSPNDPLIQQHQHKIALVDDDATKALEDREVDGAVYKSTIDKVEIKEPIKYSGLSKDELERYAHDPYWRRMRYFFLILFWLSWIAMFAAAIIIVIMSPKCPPKPQLHWWHKKTCYQIWTRSFKDSNGDGVGDLNGMSHQLKFMSVFKTSAIWPVPLLESTSGKGYDVSNHKKIDPVLGTLDDFDNFVETAHQKEMYVIIDLPLTTVSDKHEWFVKSSAKEPGYENFFHWRNVPGNGSVWSQPAGTARSAEYYRHWGATKYPLLNWDEPAVREAMKDVALFWMKHKVDGFYLGEVQYMSLNSDNKPNWDKIHSYLKEFNQQIRNNSDAGKITTFTSTGLSDPGFGTVVDEFTLAMNAHADVDYVISNELLKVNKSCNVSCIHDHLEKAVDFYDSQPNMSWPMWEVGHPYTNRLATRMGSRARGEMISLMQLMLPGSVNIYYGDEIGMIDGTKGEISDLPRTPMQWSSDSQAGFSSADKLVIPVNEDYTTVNFKKQNLASYSTLKMFKRLATLRQSDDSILHGRISLSPVNADDILLLNISSTYNPTHYAVILNFGSEGTYNLAQAPYNLNLTGREASFYASTTNVNLRKAFVERESVDVTKLKLMPDEGIVVRFKNSK